MTASVAPAISITGATPLKPRPSNYEIPTRAVNRSSERLLYRGALSLPDSHLLLDGLTFYARSGSPGKWSESKMTHLFDNPLALALESMRGRRSLRFLNVVKMRDIWIDESGGVQLDIHPLAILSRIYFENMFCLNPLSASVEPLPSTIISDAGIKVALGDTDGPETTYIVIFARVADQTLQPSPPKLDLMVARITPAPLPSVSQMRLPRPDDPIPRRPPLIFAASTGIAKGKPRELKRTALTATVGAGEASSSSKRQKTTPLENFDAGFADLGSDFRLEDPNKVPFLKVPELPGKTGKKGKEKARKSDPEMEDDVFGGGAAVVKSGSKAKQKELEKGDGESPVEKENRQAVKKTAVHYLTSGFRSGGVETPPVSKSHPDFKELFNWVYRGTCYALREDIKTMALDSDVIEKFVKNHVAMYVLPKRW